MKELLGGRLPYLNNNDNNGVNDNNNLDNNGQFFGIAKLINIAGTILLWTKTIYLLNLFLTIISS